MEYGNATVEAAASAVIEKLKHIGGSGGLIAVSADGFAMPFNTSGMYRAMIDETGKETILIF